MLTVRVAVKVHANGVEAFLGALADTPGQVLDRFPKCRWFDVYIDADDPLRVLVYEEWDTQDAYEESRTSDYVHEVMSVLMPLMDGQPDTAYYQSESVEPWWH